MNLSFFIIIICIIIAIIITVILIKYLTKDKSYLTLNSQGFNYVTSGPLNLNINNKLSINDLEIELNLIQNKATNSTTYWSASLTDSKNNVVFKTPYLYSINYIPQQIILTKETISNPPITGPFIFDITFGQCSQSNQKTINYSDCNILNSPPFIQNIKTKLTLDTN